MSFDIVGYHRTYICIFIESLNGSFRDEYLSKNKFLYLQKTKSKIEQCVREYNKL